MILQLDGQPIRPSFEPDRVNLKAGPGVVLSGRAVAQDRRMDITVTALESGVFLCGARAAVAANNYIRTINGIVMTAAIGFFCPWDIEVTAISYAKVDTVAGTLEVRDDGVLTAAALATGAAATGSVSGLAVSIAAGSVMSVFWTSAGNLTDAVVNVFWRRAS